MTRLAVIAATILAVLGLSLAAIGGRNPAPAPAPAASPSVATLAELRGEARPSRSIVRTRSGPAPSAEARRQESVPARPAGDRVRRTTRKAPSVNAAAMGVWDRLAECESGGRWGANTGNGYFGGLQWLPSTWRLAGGTKYAAMPHHATREQQIAVAQSWLARTSWGQWPTCSRKLGLR